MVVEFKRKVQIIAIKLRVFSQELVKKKLATKKLVQKSWGHKKVSYKELIP